MSKIMSRTYRGTIDELGAGAKSTLETFIINQLGDDASADLEVTVDATNIKKAIIWWKDDGTVTLHAFFQEEGVWTAD